jgi:SAM-dependent methyltransferase
MSRLGGAADLDFLELGPLEGGHTWMLCQRGARSVTSVEANSRAYLRCLISKELLGMSAAHFLLGDFLSYLKATDRRFDAILASGVLYHMQDPIALLREIGRHSDRLVLWTHYYDQAVLTPDHSQYRMFAGAMPLVGVDGASIQGYRRYYLESLESQTFCGSGSTWSVWLERPTILHSLEAMGYSNIRIDVEVPDDPHGPSFLVTAWR